MRTFVLVMAMAVAFVQAGCSTLADARAAQGTGAKRTYNAGYDETWDATLKSLNSLGLPIAADNKTSGQIVAQRGITAFSYGENVAIFVTKEDAAKTQVEVVSKRAMSTNIFAPDWSKDILDRIPSYLAK